MPSELTYALVGVGDIAQAEYDAITDAAAGRVELVMDAVAEHARRFAEPRGVRWTDSYDEGLVSPVDVVVIAVPHHLHAELAIRAAEAGKHVVLEKPIATTVDDATAIIDACANHGVQLAVAYVQRYRPANVRARELVRSGAIGQVLHVHVTDLFEKPESYWYSGYSGAVRTDWRASVAKSGGGVWMMNMSHTIDYVIDIIGAAPTSVYGVAANRGTPAVEVEDDVSAVIRFANGAVATMTASTVAAGDPRSEELICGSAGTLRLGNPLQLYLRRPWEDLPANGWVNVAVDERDPWQDGREAFFRRFAAAVPASDAMPVTGEQALLVLETVRATYDSSEKGAPVAIAGR